MNQTLHARTNTCSCTRENQNNPCNHILPIHNFPELTDKNPQARYPCGTCERIVTNRNKALQCVICNYWNHIKCDGILPYDYDKFKKLPQAVQDKNIHFCKKCKEDSIPFLK